MERQHLSQRKNAITQRSRDEIAPLQTQIARYSPHPIEELQGLIGNRAVNQLLANQPPLPAKPMFRGLSQEFRSDLTQINQPIQAKEVDSASVEEAQTENKTGLPDNLKVGIEILSGIAMDDVRVHKNSSQPSQLQALAYTQGTDIHVAPGQEKHLPHEAWHVVQQKQGRVKPTMQAKGVGINDDRALEKEADKISNYWNHSQVRAETDRVTSIPALPVNSNYNGVYQLKGTAPVSSAAEKDYSEWEKEIEKWIDERYPRLNWIDKEQLKALMLEEAIKYAAAHPDRYAVGEGEAIGESEIARVKNLRSKNLRPRTSKKLPSKNQNKISQNLSNAVSAPNEEDKKAPEVFDPCSSGKPSDEVPDDVRPLNEQQGQKSTVEEKKYSRSDVSRRLWLLSDEKKVCLNTIMSLINSMETLEMVKDWPGWQQNPEEWQKNYNAVETQYRNLTEELKSIIKEIKLLQQLEHNFH